MSDATHRWEDVSYHGSPIYECEIYKCEFCGCRKRSPEAALPCPEAAEKLRQEQEKLEQQEKWEWKQLEEKIARFFYLARKYGGWA